MFFLHCYRFFKRRNRRYILYILIGLSVFWTLFTGEDNNDLYEKDSSLLKERFIQAEKDDDMDTSTYLESYNNFVQQRSQFKRQTYYENSALKKEYTYSTHRAEHLNKPYYLIYEYTPFFGGSKFCQLYDANGKEPEIFLKNCPYTNCKFTCDADKVATADVLLFHEGDIKNLIRADSKYIDKVIDIRRQRPDQIFTLWNDEANYVSDNIDPIKFNWTISYRLDSEVSDCAYGCIFKRARPLQKNEFQSQLFRDFLQRKNHAIWFVSNCNSKKRLKFALDVQRKFPVRIFGACKLLTEWQSALGFSHDSIVGRFFSTLAVALGSLFKYGKCGAFRGHGSCEIKEVMETKFFFSFESKNCSNLYVTEKFFRILRHNVVPVLFQPNRQFYEKIAPPNSFIHAQDFDFDAEKLAEYLHKVCN